MTDRTLSGLFWTAGAKLGRGLLQILILAVLARLLTPADFGVVSAALVVIGVSAIFSQIGLAPALIQRPELEPRHTGTAFTTSLLLGASLGAVMWWVAPVVATFYRTDDVGPVLQALALVFPLQGLATVSQALLRRELRFRWLAGLEVVTYGLGYGAVGVPLALLGWGAWALVAAHLAHEFLSTVAVMVKRPPRPRGLGEWRALRELMYFGSGFTVAKIANYVALHGDNVAVGRFLGPAALGFYSRAYQLMAVPANSVGRILDDVLFPAMARVQDDSARLASAYRRSVALIGLVVLPPSVAFIVLAPEVIRIVLGPGWNAVVAPAQILAIGMLFRTSYKMSDSLARSTGVVYRRAWRQVLYAGLVLVGAWVGQHWGIAGVAWGVLAAVTVNFLLMAQLSLSVARMTWASLWRAHLPAGLLAAVSGPIVWIGASALRSAGLPGPVVATAGVVLMLTVCGVLVWRAPAIFLRRDGAWMLEKLGSFAPLKAAHARLDRGAGNHEARATP